MNAPTTSGAEAESQSVLPAPPSATLRAPADDRREEVDSESGLAPTN